jgi:hypothetical protein
MKYIHIYTYLYIHIHMNIYLYIQESNKLGNEIKDEIILKPFPISLEFLNLGFIELIKCRLILRGSFAYAFYMHADEDEYESNVQSSPGRKLSRRCVKYIYIYMYIYIYVHNIYIYIHSYIYLNLCRYKHVFIYIDVMFVY